MVEVQSLGAGPTIRQSAVQTRKSELEAGPTLALEACPVRSIANRGVVKAQRARVQGRTLADQCPAEAAFFVLFLESHKNCSAKLHRRPLVRQRPRCVCNYHPRRHFSLFSSSPTSHATSHAAFFSHLPLSSIPCLRPTDRENARGLAVSLEGSASAAAGRDIRRTVLDASPVSSSSPPARLRAAQREWLPSLWQR